MLPCGMGASRPVGEGRAGEDGGAGFQGTGSPSASRRGHRVAGAKVVLPMLAPFARGGTHVSPLLMIASPPPQEKGPFAEFPRNAESRTVSAPLSEKTAPPVRYACAQRHGGFRANPKP